MSKPLPDNLGDLSREQIDELIAAAKADGAGYVAKGYSKLNDEEFEQLRSIAEYVEGLNTHLANIAARETEGASLFDKLNAPTPEAPAAAAPALPVTPEPTPDPAAEVIVPDNAAALEGELVTASAAKTAAVDTLREPSLNNRIRTLSLREAQLKRASRGGFTPYDTSEELVITTAADVPGYLYDTPLEDRIELAKAFQRRAKNMVDQPGLNQRVTVATVKRKYDVVLDEKMRPEEIEDAFKRLADPSQLWESGIPTTAGGGWCALPMPTYNFFNITCEDGMFDAPTFGVERGGITFPVSPSLADVYTGTFTSGTNPWLWTNTDDVATVTGSPNKPCVRVPCATNTTVLLECYGICLTAGNLTNNAWPEQTANYLRLLRSAQFHAINARYIQSVVSLASAVVTSGVAGAGLIAPLLSQIELQATNYRVKYGMCQTEVLEVVLPFWIIGAMRADLSRRQGVTMQEIGITDNQIADWFDARHIRAQFVSDWQVRASGQIGNATPITSWPTSVDFLVYAAGTIMIGNGMTLDLGVVRDSVLNAENDYTAAWAEECHLVARVGHEVGQYRVNICPDGTVGAADLTACM